jgi:hypothetical protein
MAHVRGGSTSADYPPRVRREPGRSDTIERSAPTRAVCGFAVEPAPVQERAEFGDVAAGLQPASTLVAWVSSCVAPIDPEPPIRHTV